MERANFVENVNSSNHHNTAQLEIEGHIEEFGAGKAQSQGDSECIQKCINNENQDLSNETNRDTDDDNSITQNETSSLIVDQDSSNQSQVGSMPSRPSNRKSPREGKRQIDYTESDYEENEHYYGRIQRKKRRSNPPASDEVFYKIQRLFCLAYPNCALTFQTTLQLDDHLANGHRVYKFRCLYTECNKAFEHK